jgi:hypothetical protein
VCKYGTDFLVTEVINPLELGPPVADRLTVESVNEDLAHKNVGQVYQWVLRQIRRNEILLLNGGAILEVINQLQDLAIKPRELRSKLPYFFRRPQENGHGFMSVQDISRVQVICNEVHSGQKRWDITFDDVRSADPGHDEVTGKEHRIFG